MSDKITLGRCSEAECSASENGECYEGNEDFTSCPNFILFSDENEDNIEDYEDETEDEETEIEDSLEDVEVDQSQIGKTLYEGKELDYASSLRITLASLTKIIVLAGANDAGKTTLLASLYDHFQEGTISNYLFAGSETLLAFDKRSHLSRTDSGRDTEDTERSKSASEQTMLHLCVRHESLTKPRQDLLLSDIWGEFFKNAVKSKDEAAKIKMLPRANHFVILVDGAKLTQLATRNQAVTNAKMILRSFLEAEMISAGTLVDIVFTKNDLIEKAIPGNETDKFIETTENEFRLKYESKVRGLFFYKIAARPAEGIEWYGVTELFRHWMEDSLSFPTKVKDASTNSKYIVSSPREIDLYSSIQLPHKFTRKEDLNL